MLAHNGARVARLRNFFLPNKVPRLSNVRCSTAVPKNDSGTWRVILKYPGPYIFGQKTSIRKYPVIRCHHWGKSFIPNTGIDSLKAFWVLSSESRDRFKLQPNSKIYQAPWHLIPTVHHLSLHLALARWILVSVRAEARLLQCWI